MKAELKFDKKQEESRNSNDRQTPAIKKLAKGIAEMLESETISEEELTGINDIVTKEKQYAKAMDLVERKMPAFRRISKSEAKKNLNAVYALNNYFYSALSAKAYARAAKWANDPHIQELAEVNPYIFHNTACIYARLGKLDAALDQVKKAKKFKYSRMDKIASDTELKKLYGNPEFKKAVGK